MFAVSKRDQVLQLLYIILHRLETFFIVESDCRGHDIKIEYDQQYYLRSLSIKMFQMYIPFRQIWKRNSSPTTQY